MSQIVSNPQKPRNQNQQQQQQQHQQEQTLTLESDPLHNCFLATFSISFHSDFESDSDSESESDSDSDFDLSDNFFEPHQPGGGVGGGGEQADPVSNAGSGMDLMDDDLGSWVFEDGDNNDALMDDLGSGFGVLNPNQSGRGVVDGGGLRVAGIDSDSDSEVLDLINGGNLDMGVDNNNDEDNNFGLPGLWDRFVFDDPMDIELGLDQNMGLDRLDEELSSISVSASQEYEEEDDDDDDLILQLERELLVPFDGIEGGPLDLDAEYNAFLEQLLDNDVDFGGPAALNFGGRPPTARRVLENLPLVEKEEELKGVVCAICMDEVVLGEVVNRLPCCHCFHGKCILPWLRVRNTCPICRYELPTDDQEYESSSRRGNLSGGASGGLADSADGYNFEMLA